jgi:hypothetical protein
VLQGLVDRPSRERAEDAAFAVEQRSARGDRLPAARGFGDLGAAVPVDLLHVDLGQSEPREVRQQVATDRPLVVGQCARREALAASALEPLGSELVNVGSSRGGSGSGSGVGGSQIPRRTSARTFDSSSSARLRVQPSDRLPRVS